MVSVMELVSAGIGAFGLEALGFTAQVRSHRSPIALLLDHSLRPRQGVQDRDLVDEVRPGRHPDLAARASLVGRVHSLLHRGERGEPVQAIGLARGGITAHVDHATRTIRSGTVGQTGTGARGARALPEGLHGAGVRAAVPVGRARVVTRLRMPCPTIPLASSACSGTG